MDTIERRGALKRLGGTIASMAAMASAGTL
jgi:hypothetical protein